SGTSMASPIVAGTAALMLQQDPTLNPATVKARLMLSAHKPGVGDPFSTGAGYLDILGALRATGQVTDARSPLATPDAASGQIAFENTAVLWGNDAFNLIALWGNGVIWSDLTQQYQPTVWTLGENWPSSELFPNTELWPSDELFPNDELWPDINALFPRVLDPDPGSLGVMTPLSLGDQDP